MTYQTLNETVKLWNHLTPALLMNDVGGRVSAPPLPQIKKKTPTDPNFVNIRRN